jgi:hypothetical protein
MLLVAPANLLSPVAEKTFQSLRNAAGKNPDVNFIAVSHSDQEATDKWIIAVGGEWDTHVIVDAEREVYAQWGLGVSSAWHVLNPWSMYSVWKLGKQENIWNKPTESGSRWQTVCYPEHLFSWSWSTLRRNCC